MAEADLIHRNNGGAGNKTDNSGIIRKGRDDLKIFFFVDVHIDNRLLFYRLDDMLKKIL